MSNLTFSTEQTQKQTVGLSQQQRYSLGVLAMPAVSLGEFIDKELESNPVLEPDEGCSPALSGQDAAHDPEPYESHRTQQQSRTLREELLFQLVTGEFSFPLSLGEYMIACLNANGYLEVEEAAIAQGTGLDLAQVSCALTQLQRLEPTGVFARSLSECLLLQLRGLPQRNPVAETIAERYLEQAAQNRLDFIARELHQPLGLVKEAFALIKTLNPKPGSGFFTEHPHYIVPDVQVTVRDGQARVSVLAGAGVHVNSYYLDRLPLVDSLTRDYLKGEIGRGNFLIRCLEQRRATLLSVASEAVRRQQAFFVQGGPLGPLTMGELAQALDLHESTISRAVSGKYLRYSGGTVPLSKLFCGSLTGGNSPQSAKQCLAALVEGEDKQEPFSDEKLAALLEGEGIVLSRRGVAKYREELGIPPSRSRRRW